MAFINDKKYIADLGNGGKFEALEYAGSEYYYEGVESFYSSSDYTDNFIINSENFDGKFYFPKQYIDVKKVMGNDYIQNQIENIQNIIRNSPNTTTTLEIPIISYDNVVFEDGNYTVSFILSFTHFKSSNPTYAMNSSLIVKRGTSTYSSESLFTNFRKKGGGSSGYPGNNNLELYLTLVSKLINCFTRAYIFVSYKHDGYYNGTTISVSNPADKQQLTFTYYLYEFDLNDELSLYGTEVLSTNVGGVFYTGQNILWETVESEVNGNTPPTPTTDPFDPGGTSKPDGGGGTFDGESDPVEVPDLPTVTAAKSGLLNLFNPTIGEINSISNFLWSTDWKDWITRLGSKPLEFILGLSIVPWKPRIGAAISLHLGPLDTEVVTHPLSTQYEELDFGSIDIEEYWGAVLDYSPYTSIDIFLPYIGSVSLDVDEVMGKTLHCIYHCDSLSGQVVAMLKSSDAILYQFEGNAAQNIPMTATDYTSVILGYGAAAVGLIALAAPAVVGATGAAGAGGVATAASSAALPAVSSAQIAGIGSTIAGVMTAKPHAHHTGNATGAGSQLGVQHPYLVIKRARQSLPENYNKISGYPSNIYAQVSSLSGFTVFENIRLDGVPAMDDELAEIYQYMITGVIV